MREHRLHHGLGRACLQVVKPAAEHIGVVLVRTQLRGHGEQVEGAWHNVRLQPGSILGLACQIPHREDDLLGARAEG